MSESSQYLRMVEALLFAATEPLDVATMATRLPEEADVPALLETLREAYGNRGVTLQKLGDKWAFRTARDLRFLLEQEREQPRRLSRAALETLAIVAYHQPITRAEIEEVRGVGLSKGTLDILMETGWVRIRGRKRSPGRPVTYGTGDGFLEHFSLETLQDLPGVEELKATGLLDATPPPLRLAHSSDDEAEDTEDAEEMEETLEAAETAETAETELPAS